MSAALAVTSVGVIAGLDVVFSGLRASLGRSGLIDHRRDDLRGIRRGALVGTVAVLPAAAVFVLTAGSWTPSELTRSAGTMLLVLVPYAAVVVAALLVYGLLPWRWRYLASAAILGPMTFLRPAVACLAAVLGTITASSAGVGATIWLGTVAVLAVEPICDRLWARDSAQGAQAPATPAPEPDPESAASSK
jgi:hypothetical protein